MTGVSVSVTHWLSLWLWVCQCVRACDCDCESVSLVLLLAVTSRSLTQSLTHARSVSALPFTFTPLRIHSQSHSHWLTTTISEQSVIRRMRSRLGASEWCNANTVECWQHWLTVSDKINYNTWLVTSTCSCNHSYHRPKYILVITPLPALPFTVKDNHHYDSHVYSVLYWLESWVYHNHDILLFIHSSILQKIYNDYICFVGWTSWPAFVPSLRRTYLLLQTW